MFRRFYLSLVCIGALAAGCSFDASSVPESTNHGPSAGPAVSPAAVSPAAVSPAAVSPAAVSPAAVSPAAVSPAVAPLLQEDLAGFVLRVLPLGGAAAEDRLPLLVALHGLGSTPERFATLYDDFPRPARLVAVRAPDAASHGGWSWFLFSRGDVDQAALAVRILATTMRLAGLLQALPERYLAVGKPIVTGFSQGGMLSFALAARFPELLGAALPVGGTLYPDLLPAEAQLPGTLPVVVAFHGQDDPVVPIDGARQSIEALQGLGFQASLKAYPATGHEIPAAMRADYLQAISALLSSSAVP